MSNDIEARREEARADFAQDSQTQMANEQTIRDAEQRNARNAELSRLRAEAERQS